MTDDEQEARLRGWQQLHQALQSVLEKQEKRTAAEAARRARLTPEQRAAEDRARRETLARAEQAQVRAHLTELGDALFKRETWTIDDFCWLLAAQSPEEPSGWTLLDVRPAKAIRLHKQFTHVLQSCVPTRLKPVNPKEPANRHRFAVAALLEVARLKGLGCFEVLSELMGKNSAQPAKASRLATGKALAATGTQSRETEKLRRRIALVNIARAVAESGEGSVEPTQIRLSINGKELNRRFKEQVPEWRGIGDKTLEADRSECKPRITVMTGRPRKLPV